MFYINSHRLRRLLKLTKFPLLPGVLPFWSRSEYICTCFAYCHGLCLSGGGQNIALHVLPTARDSAFLEWVRMHLYMLCLLPGTMPFWNRSEYICMCFVYCQRLCLSGVDQNISVHALYTARDSAFLEKVRTHMYMLCLLQGTLPFSFQPSKFIHFHFPQPPPDREPYDGSASQQSDAAMVR